MPDLDEAVLVGIILFGIGWLIDKVEDAYKFGFPDWPLFVIYPLGLAFGFYVGITIQPYVGMTISTIVAVILGMGSLSLSAAYMDRRDRRKKAREENL